MSGRLLALMGPGLGAGFALAGVEVVEARDDKAAAEELERLMDAALEGVLMIDEPLYRQLPEEMQRRSARSERPVVIPVPGPEWATETTARDYIVDILRRAIGYRVRLQ